MNVRGALPGLVVMALIAGAGVLFAFVVREVVPDDLFVTEPYGALQVEDLEIDPATGLPIVPTSLFTEPTWWTAAGPNEQVDSSLSFASTRPPGTVDPGQPVVTLMATYADNAAALEVAEGLAAAVGDPLAENAWLEAVGVSPGDGFEWVGADASWTPFVQVIDRRLLVDGLRWREDHEAPVADGPETDEAVEALEAGETGADLEVGPAYRSPLALALEASAVSVLVEGDRWGRGAIAFDMVCSGDPDRLTTLAQDLADYVPDTGMRPPWVDPPLTLDERGARRTRRLLTTLRASAFVQDLLSSGEMEPKLGSLADTLDAEVMASPPGSLAQDASGEADADLSSTPGEVLAAAQRYGATEAAGYGRGGGAVYEVTAEDRRLRLQLGSWLGVAQGLEPLLDYLGANDCADPWVAFHDFDDVRGD